MTVTKGADSSGTSDRDLRVHLEIALQAMDDVARVNQAILDLRAMKAQVADRANHARSPPVGLAADVVNRRLGEVETPLVALNSRASELYRKVNAEQIAPAEENRAALKVLSEDIAAAIERVRGVLNNEVAAFNRMLGNSQMPLVEVPEALRALTRPASPPGGGSHG